MLKYFINFTKRVKMKVRIYYEDTDAGGVVYHANYFKYCERARSEAFLQNKIELFNQKCGFVVKKILNADFYKPAHLGEIVRVTSKMTSHKKASFNVHHEIFRDEEKLFETDILAVYICDGKPTRIPQETMDFLIDF